MNELENFEKKCGFSTKEAADALGLVYARYMELRRGARVLKPYHLASINAHMALPPDHLRKLPAVLTTK